MKDLITSEDGAHPNRDEIGTATFLAGQGKKVKFMAESKIQGKKSPDIKMDGIAWEIKNPRKNGKYTLDHAMKRAIKQSANIIFDIRHCRAVESRIIVALQKEFMRTKKWKRLIIITKNKGFLTFKK